MTRLLAVHGVHNYKNGDPPVCENQRIADVWSKALREHGTCDHHFDLRAAYYADLLRSDTQGADATAEDAEQQAILATLYRQWSQAWQIDLTGLQGPVTVPLRHIATAIAARSHARGDARRIETLARLFFPEVARYLGYAHDGRPHRHAVRHRIAQALAAHRPDIVIAHSLGSVAAYETLHANPDIAVQLLITLGSPLALPGAIFHRIDPAPVRGLGCKPAGVRRWINIADIGDVIAVPRGAIAHCFPDLDEHHEITIGVAAFHDVTAYLAHPKTRDVIEVFSS